VGGEYIKGKEFVIYILYIENSFHILYTPLSSNEGRIGEYIKRESFPGRNPPFLRIGKKYIYIFFSFQPPPLLSSQERGRGGRHAKEKRGLFNIYIKYLQYIIYILKAGEHSSRLGPPQLSCSGGLRFAA
jgi:hypothetical protein